MRRVTVTFLLLVVLILSSCSEHQVEINNLESMKDMSLTFGLSDDVDVRSQIMEICPLGKIIPQNDTMYGVQSVADGKVDAYVAGRIYLEKAINEGKIEGVRILDEPIYSFQCALGLSKQCQIPEFENAVKDSMQRMISDGTIKEMRQRWFYQDNDQMPDIKLDDNPVYTLNAVTFGQCKPYSFFKDGRLTGFDVELLYRLCQQNHWGLKLSNSEYTGMLMGLSTGKYDIISANLYITENRSDNIIYSTPYSSEEICVAVRGASDTKTLEYSSLSALKNAKRFAVQSGTVCADVVKEHYPQATILYFPNVVDCTLAVVNNKADAIVFDSPTLEYVAACTDGVALIPELIAKDDYHFILSKSPKGKQLQIEFNDWLNAKKQTGEIAKLYDFWCSKEEPDRIFDFSALPEINGKIKIATNATSRPDVYYYKNSVSGFPIELIYNFCQDKGYGAEVSIASFESLISSLITEKADIVPAFISYTEERAQNVLYTDCIQEGGFSVLVRTIENQNRSSLSDALRNGIQKTFVTENRWKLIVSGLKMTALITLGGFLFANILGVFFCACTMSKHKIARVFADIFDRIMQGTPMVVILMILYYVIFGKSDIPGSLVAIIAFGMTSGTSLARQFFGAIKGVDKGQTEAALAIGFTKAKAFMGIVFPQAARIALPGYFSEIIGLMKGTAIVGYISVIDLTKAGDLIRSSTYDAFFPLLTAALIYFIISFGILSLLKYIQKKLAPKRVRREADK